MLLILAKHLSKVLAINPSSDNERLTVLSAVADTGDAAPAQRITPLMR
jgi:hypothetical protein